MRAISSGSERRQAGVVPQQRRQEGLGAGGRQRVEPQLRVVRLAAPAVLVLRAVVDQQQEVRRRQALDEAVEQRLRLTVNPVQILKHQEQRLHLAFTQQHAPQGLEGALAALRRVQVHKGAVVWQDIQQRQQGREGVLERLVQGEDLARDLGPDGARRHRHRRSWQ